MTCAVVFTKVGILYAGSSPLCQNIIRKGYIFVIPERNADQYGGFVFFGLRWGTMWELTRVLTKPGMFVKQIIILTSQSLIFNVLIWFVIVRIW